MDVGVHNLLTFARLPGGATGEARWPRAWLVGATALLCEYLTITLVFDIGEALKRGGLWAHLIGLRDGGLVVAIAASASIAMGARYLATSQPASSTPSTLAWRLAQHAAAYGGFVLSTWWVLGRATAPPGPAPLWLALWAGLGLATVLTLVRAVFGAGVRPKSLLALLGIATLLGVAALGAGKLVQALWEPLTGLTLTMAAALLATSFDDVEVSGAILSAGGFAVRVDDACSGIEGAGLMLVLLPGYLAVFRDRLRFPHALLLLPLGLGTVLVANVVRIALLVGVGASWDPDLATGGFHSKIGWVFFCAITLGIVALGQFWSFLAKDAGTEDESENPTAVYLLPLLALLAVGLTAGLFERRAGEFYGLRVVAVAAMLLLYRAHYLKLERPNSGVAVVLGVAVGVGWIALAPSSAAHAPPSVSWAWLVVRVVGSVLLVPIAEELAFRGYLLRRLQDRDFTEVAWTRWTWLALLGSSLAFGVVHPRWLAATAAGLVYAAIQIRTGRIANAIVAHAASNAVVAGWVLAADDWSHWS